MLSCAGAMCPFPAILFPRGLNERGYHEQLQQQHQQKQQALEPRFPVLSWACAAPGLSGFAAICRLRISVLSDPMGCKQQRKGQVRNISLCFPFLFALNIFPRSAEGHSLKGTEKLNHWFSPMEVLRCWILWKIHSFKCCDGRQRAEEFFTCLGMQWEGSVMQRTKGRSEGSWRARALGTEVYQPRSWKGFPEVLTSRPS